MSLPPQGLREQRRTDFLIVCQTRLFVDSRRRTSSDLISELRNKAGPVPILKIRTSRRGKAESSACHTSAYPPASAEVSKTLFSHYLVPTQKPTCSQGFRLKRCAPVKRPLEEQTSKARVKRSRRDGSLRPPEAGRLLIDRGATLIALRTSENSPLNRLKGKPNPFGRIPIQRLVKANFSPPARACRREKRGSDKCQPGWSIEVCPSRAYELGSRQVERDCSGAQKLPLGINSRRLPEPHLTALQRKLPLK